MSIELPPPAQPQQGSVETLQRQAGAGVVVAFHTYQIHVSAAGVLNEAQIRSVIRVAADLSGAVRNLGGAAYLAGFPAAQVTYALSGQNLYVMVLPGKLSGIRASKTLKPYLDGLQSADPLTERTLEEHRALASLAADRAGVTVNPVFEPDGSGGHVLDFEKNTKATDPTTVKGELSNVGNRYASRYFLDLDLKTDSVWGDEFHVFTRHGLSQFNDKADPNGDYNEQDLAWNRVTPYGIFGISGRNIDYFYTSATIPINGRIDIGEVSWLYPLYADFTRRLMLQTKIDRTDQLADLQDSVGTSPAGSELNHQLYNSGELDLSYGQNFQLIAHRWSFEGNVTLRKGLGSDDSNNTLVLANQGYLLYRPFMRLKFYWNNAIDTGIEGSGQFSNTTLPQVQQWVLGGLGNLTSALPGVAIGDRGYLARAYTEFTLPMYFGVTFTPKLFIEQGAARFAEPTTLNGDTVGTQKLVDAGAELDFKFAKYVDGSFAYAHAISEQNISQTIQDSSRAQLYFRIAAKF